MKYLKIIGIVLLLLLAGSIFFIVFTTGEDTTFFTGPEFEYAGLSDVKNGQYDKKRDYIILRDGTKIAITSLIPNNRIEKEFPVILIYTPYTSSIVVPEMTLVDRIASKYYTGKWGPAYENESLYKINAYTSNGYAMAFVDMRGTGSSTGYSGAFDDMFIKDSEEILAWIAQQSWSNKRIGMMGQSYMGWSQFSAASTKSPYLKCIVPEVIFFNMYTEAIRPGGILAQRWLSEYSQSTIELNNRNLWNTSFDIPSYPSEPVIDEDGDGKLYDEVPILIENDLNSYDGNLQYADGKERKESAYISLTKEHEKNIWPSDVGSTIKYVDDTYEYYGKTKSQSDVSVDYLIYKLKETKIPVLLIGGFFDGFSRGILQSFANLHDTNPVSVLMTPRTHLGLSYGYGKMMDFKYNSRSQTLSTQLQFFDKYLKGIDNGYDSKPPVKIYTAFEGWNYYDSWPPKEATSMSYSLGADNSLKNKNEGDTVYTYEVDFTHSSSYGSNEFNPQMMHRWNDSLMIRNEHDKKCLVFETSVLDTSLTLMGSPIINLNISSNQNNADIYVYLSDVDTAGVVHYVSEGKLRAGWHKLFNNNQMVNGLYDVKPELPWHSFKKEDYDTIPFANDSIVTLKFDLKPQAWKFRTGHKIRVSIAGADYGNYEFNPVLCPDNSLKSCKPTTLNIHTGRKRQSYIVLPIVN
jgi:putative CocE/NonD family hydrolase